TGYAKSVFVNKIILLQNKVNSTHQIGIVFSAIILPAGVHKLLSVTMAAARVGIQYDIAFGSEQLHFMKKCLTVHGVRTTMDLQYALILIVSLKSIRAKQPALNVPAVICLEPQCYRFTQLYLIHKFPVGIR